MTKQSSSSRKSSVRKLLLQITLVAGVLEFGSACRITAFRPETEDMQITYKINSGPLLSDSLKFAQEPDCGYPLETTLLGGPSFVTLDITGNRLIIDTNQVQHRGVHQLTLESSFLDIEKARWKATSSVTLIVQDGTPLAVGCTQTQFDNFLVADQVIVMAGPASTIQLPFVNDSVGKTKTPIGFCGTRAFMIVGRNAVRSFVNLDLTSNKVSFQSKSDTDIGRRTIQIKVFLIEAPEISRTSALTVTVKPCLEGVAFTVTMNTPSLYYTVGDPPVTDFRYQFKQQNNCGYTVKVTIEKVITYLAHNTESKDFTIYTESPDARGINYVTVKGSIFVPSDWTKASVQEIKTQVSFFIVVKNDCKFTVLKPSSAMSLQANAQPDPLVFELSTPQDSVSFEKGNGDGFTFCGERVFTLVQAELFPWISINKNKLVVDTSASQSIKEFKLEVSVTLKSFPAVTPVSLAVTLVIVGQKEEAACQIMSLTPPKLRFELIYFINQGPVEITTPTWGQEPICDYALGYSFSVDQQQPLPSWVKFQEHQGSPSLVVDTNNESLLGTKLDIYATVATRQDYPFDAVSAQDFAGFVEVRADCHYDEIKQLAPLEDRRVTLTSEANSPVEIPIRVEKAISSCETVFGLERLIGQTWTPITDGRIDVAREDAASPRVVIDTLFDQGLDGQVWSVRLTAWRADKSQGQAVKFKVTFRYACWDSILSPADVNSFSFGLFKDKVVFPFTAASLLPSQSVGCSGAATHSLVYVGGPLDFTASLIVDEQNTTIRGGVFSQKSILGSHMVKLKGNLGNFTASFSNTFAITFTDPCLETQIDTSGIPATLSVTSARLSETIVVNGPKTMLTRELNDSGAELCGKIQSQLMGADGLTPAQSPFLKISASSGKLTLAVSQDSTDGPIRTEQFMISLRSEEYPTITSKLVPISLNYRECVPVGFKGQLLNEVVIALSSGQDPVLVPITLDQSPCKYLQTFEAFLDTDTGRKPLPSFMAFSADTMVLSIREPATVGFYSVVVKSQISNSIGSEAATTLSVRVIQDCSFDIITELTRIPDQTVNLVHTVPAKVVLSFTASHNLEECPIRFSVEKQAETITATYEPIDSKRITVESGKLTIESSYEEGLIGKTWFLRLIAANQNNQNSVSTEFALSFIYECSPYDFAATPIDDFSIGLDSGHELKPVFISFDQAPCSYEAKYETALETPAGEVALPTWINFSDENQSITFENPLTQVERGNYKVIVRIILPNADKSTVKVSFNVNVTKNETFDNSEPLIPHEESSEGVPEPETPAEEEIPVPEPETPADDEIPVPEPETPAEEEIPVPEPETPANDEIPVPEPETPADDEIPVPEPETPAEEEIPVPEPETPADDEIPVPEPETPKEETAVDTSERLPLPQSLPNLLPYRSHFSPRPSFNLKLDDTVLVYLGVSQTIPIRYERIDALGDDTTQPYKLNITFSTSPRIAPFVRHAQNDNALLFDGKGMTESEIGFHSLKVVVTFTSAGQQIKLSGKMRLDVRQKMFQVSTLDGEKIRAEDVFFLSEWNGLISYPTKFSSEQPVPYVDSLTETGVLTIRWDRPLKEIDCIDLLPSKEVLIRQGVSQRALQSGKWLSKDSSSHLRGELESVEVRKALQLTLIRENLEGRAISWHVISSDHAVLKIQAELSQGDLVRATLAAIPILQIQFWGTSLFKSLDETEVRLGVTLQHPIFTVLSQEQADNKEMLVDWLKGCLSVLLLLMAVLAPFGTLLPSLLFFNSAQLIVHIPFLNAQLHPLLQTILIDFQCLLKLDWLMRSESHWRIAEDGRVPLFNWLRNYNGFSDAYSSSVIFGSASLIVLSLIAAFAARLKCLNSLNRLSNVTVRVLYTFVLEVAICATVNLAFRHDPSPEVFTQCTTVGVIVMVTAFTLFTIALGLCKGPYTEGLYQKWTVAASLWQRRPLREKSGLIVRLPIADQALLLARMKRRKKNYFLASSNQQTRQGSELHLLKIVSSVRIEAEGFESGQQPKIELNSAEKCLVRSKDALSQSWDNESKSKESPLRSQRIFKRTSMESELSKLERVLEESDAISPKLKANTEAFDPGHGMIRVEGEHQDFMTMEGGEAIAKQEECSHKDLNRVFKSRSCVQMVRESSVKAECEEISFVADEFLSRSVLISPRKMGLFTSKTVPAEQRSSLSQRLDAADLDECLDDPVVLAQIKSRLSNSIVVSQRYGTIFSGLKLDHPRQVAIVHPLLYIARRLVFLASVLLFIEEMKQPIYAMLCFLLTTLLMLGYSLHELQWDTAALNNQNITNEIFIYIFALLLLTSEVSHLASGSVQDVSGQLMIWLLFAGFLVSNAAFMLFTWVRVGYMILQRLKNLRRQRASTQKRSSKKVAPRVVGVIENAKDTALTPCRKGHRRADSLSNMLQLPTDALLKQDTEPPAVFTLQEQAEEYDIRSAENMGGILSFNDQVDDLEEQIAPAISYCRVKSESKPHRSAQANFLDVFESNLGLNQPRLIAGNRKSFGYAPHSVAETLNYSLGQNNLDASSIKDGFPDETPMQVMKPSGTEEKAFTGCEFETLDRIGVETFQPHSKQQSSEEVGQVCQLVPFDCSRNFTEEERRDAEWLGLRMSAENYRGSFNVIEEEDEISNKSIQLCNLQPSLVLDHGATGKVPLKEPQQTLTKQPQLHEAFLSNHSGHVTNEIDSKTGHNSKLASKREQKSESHPAKNSKNNEGRFSMKKQGTKHAKKFGPEQSRGQSPQTQVVSQRFTADTLSSKRRQKQLHLQSTQRIDTCGSDAGQQELAQKIKPTLRRADSLRLVNQRSQMTSQRNLIDQLKNCNDMFARNIQSPSHFSKRAVPEISPERSPKSTLRESPAKSVNSSKLAMAASIILANDSLRRVKESPERSFGQLEYHQNSSPELRFANEFVQKL